MNINKQPNKHFERRAKEKEEVKKKKPDIQKDDLMPEDIWEHNYEIGKDHQEGNSSPQSDLNQEIEKE